METLATVAMVLGATAGTVGALVLRAAVRFVDRVRGRRQKRRVVKLRKKK